jgi:hypothetical protein
MVPALNRCIALRCPDFPWRAERHDGATGSLAKITNFARNTDGSCVLKKNLRCAVAVTGIVLVDEGFDFFFHPQELMDFIPEFS